MTGRLGVLVAVLALSASASAKPKAPTKKAPAAPVEAPPPAAADDGSAGSDVPAPLPHVTGPKLVDIGNNSEVDLPAGMWLFDRDVAKPIIEKGGDNADLLAAYILPDSDTARWSLQIDYADDGYVSDTDANELDADELLRVIQQGTMEQNQHRRAVGAPELFVDGWSEKPHYDKVSHHLIWAITAHDSTGPVINYFTRILGRNGYMSVNLVDAPETIEQSKVAAAAVLAGTRFRAGSTYADHTTSDKSSGMGLKALVLGGAGVVAYSAAKGGGLIAILLVMKKGVIVLVAGIAAFFKKIFGRTKKVQLPPDGPPPSDGPPVG